ncbi:hypothetical protein [Caecibacteroides pullorum]|uniref:Uncharacterized protein n=1 Tax=Caecibacteroides pullorum TaxID=2725562 RepID=A0AA40ZRK9_9BACT|nr:hypothetical protein [Caecibacteroides pullorum]MBM6856628.1 hypothetical protein [Caecibacteroides pullorum]MBV8057634.1 hypothetical protein [Caecibacteroides pullorum]
MKEEKQEGVIATEEMAAKIADSSFNIVQTDVLRATHTSVVIPYCKEFAQGKELLYALRSWDKNCCFPADFVVIGDKEEWFSDEIHFIECPRVSDNPSVDTYHKLKVALESDLVTDDFIWTNDDIYVLQPIDLSHIQLPKVLGPLDTSKYKGFYRENMQRTIDFLKQLGASCQNYGTHTPVMFNKASWLGMIAKLDEQITQGMLYTSIYFNLQQPQVTAVTLDWRKDPFLLPVVSQNPSTEVVKSLLPKMFLNNARSGYSPWLESFLDKEFPAKCLFEQ